MTRILGIETSCDETAASVVEDGRTVLSSVVHSQHDLHEEYGGVVPEIASRAHAERILPTVRAALAEAGVGWGDVDAVAVGHRPGLIGALLVGVSAAKALAWSLDVPLLGVDHVRAHLWAGCLGREVPAFPAMGLVVSGGHTTLYRCDDPLTFERLGGTIDDAMGEAFDKVAAMLGLGHPGGPLVERLAAGGDPRAHDFPISRLSPQSLDFSFSGLKTAVLYAVRGNPGPGGTFERDAGDLSEKERADIAASFQRVAVAAVELKLRRAIARTEERGEVCGTLLCGGGVIANGALRGMLERVAEEAGMELVLPEMGLCVDNAAMIAGLGWWHLEQGDVSDLTLRAVPTTGC